MCDFACRKLLAAERKRQQALEQIAELRKKNDELEAQNEAKGSVSSKAAGKRKKKTVEVELEPESDGSSSSRSSSSSSNSPRPSSSSNYKRIAPRDIMATDVAGMMLQDRVLDAAVEARGYRYGKLAELEKQCGGSSSHKRKHKKHRKK